MDVDENVFLREALRESEERHRVTLKTAMDGFFRTDMQGRIIEVNETYCRMSGYSAQELLTMNILDIDVVYSAEMITAKISRLAELGPKRFESLYRRKDGSLFDVEISGQYQPIAGGHIVIFVRDITGRKRGEQSLQAQALERSEAYLAEAERLNHSGSWAFNLASNKYVYLSEECFRSFELDAQEGLPTREAVSRLIHPEDWDKVKGDFEKLLREKVDASSEFRLVLPSGTVKHVQTIRHPVLNDAEEVVAIVGTTIDITERKRAEEALRLASVYNRSLIEASLDPLVTIDKQGKISDVNAATEQVTGYARSALIGTDFSDYFTEPEKARAGYQQVFNQGFVRDYDLEIRNRNGESTPVLYNASVYRDDAGNVIGVFAAARDIAKQKRAENERLSHLRFFQNMDRINRAMQGTNDLEQMMSDVLDAMISIFDSDRAFLVHPCDPDAASFEAVIERTRPECPGRRSANSTAPDNAKHFQLYLASSGAVTLGPGGDYPLEISRFDEKSKIMIALYPKTGKPWVLGMHQCSYPRVWTHDERRLLEEIARRIGDVLTGLLAHRDLRENEERNRMILETAMDGFFRTDMQGRILEVNVTYCQMSGYSEQELLTMNILDIEAVHDTEMIAANIRKTVELGPNRFESVHRRKDGSLFDVEISAQYQPVGGGQAVVFVRNISERKQAEENLRHTTEALRRSEAYLAEAQRLSHTGSWAFDFASNKYVYASEECLRIFELDAQEDLPTREVVSRRVHPEDWDKVGEDFEKSLREKVDATSEFRLVLPSGAAKHIHVIRHPVLNKAGDVVELVGTAIDITDRKRAEEALRLADVNLSNIIDSMPSMLVGMDNARTVTQWSRQAEAFTGIPAGEAIGKPIVDLLPDFAPWIITMGTDMDEHRPSSMEKLLIEKKGERRFYDLMLYPLLIDAVGGAVLRIEDVTERARIQELMVQTEKMMSIGGLAAGMAHEINNPLGIITQAAQNIERRISLELDANRKVSEELGLNLEGIRAYFDKRQISDAIASIRTASSRAAKIVANMLQFSRRADTTMEFTSLAQIVDQALELAASDYDLKKKYDFRSIEIIKDYQDTPQVPIVSVEIEQVILNLLKNAAQAMIANPPDRRPSITFRLRCEGGYAVLEVEDNGPGMTEDIRRRVFEPFFTTKEPGGGTGLGLSVSYMIVTQNHKGLMEVQSTPGGGTVFKVKLPIGGEQT